MDRPHIQVILAAEHVPDNLRIALQRTPASAGFCSLAEALRGESIAHADALVLVLPDEPAHLGGVLRTLFDRLAERPRATLVLTPAGHALPPLEHPPTVPVTAVCGLDAADLSARLSTMLAMRESLDSLHRCALANRRNGQSAANRYTNQLRLASQVQRGFLPESLPRLGRVSFHVVFCPVDYVSGDIYDVHRLDEEHVGIALADASGHGIPAALLTVYIKRALRGKEIAHGSYRILAPDEVLSALNEDILDASLSDCPFVAAAYAVLNTRTFELSLARGGAPYPLLRTADGNVQLLTPAGSVVGVLPDAHFEVTTLQLQPGYSLLLYSDGLERIVAPQRTAGRMPAPLRRAAQRIADSPRTSTTALSANAASLDSGSVAVATLPQPRENAVTDSAWCATLRNQGPAAALREVSARQRALRRMGFPLDDLSVLAVCVDEDAEV